MPVTSTHLGFTLSENRRRHRNTTPRRPPGRGTPAATKLALHSVARRYRVLSEEIAELEARIERVVREVAPGALGVRRRRTELGGRAAEAKQCGAAALTWRLFPHPVAPLG